MGDNVLYAREAENDSTCENVSSEGNEDIWDDTLLIKAYERAINLAKDQIGNNEISTLASHADGKEEGSNLTKSSKEIRKSKKSSSNNVTWKVGMPCRATYSADGLEYEANIVQLMPRRGKCVIRYIGYNNEEEVNIEDLQPSRGEGFRHNQIVQSSVNRGAEGSTMTEEGMRAQGNSNYNNMPEYPPGFMFTPPPPSHLMTNFPKTEDEALSSMLMSWYLSGFHTGYYQGMTKTKATFNQCSSCSGRQPRKSQ